MLNRIKIVSGLLLLFVLINILQISSGAMSYYSLNSNKKNTEIVSTINLQHDYLNKSFISLLQVRTMVSLVGINYALNHDSTATSPDIATLLDRAEKSLLLARQQWSQYEAIKLPVAINPQKRDVLRQTYMIYANSLAEMIVFMKHRDLASGLNQPTQKIQDNFEKAYIQFIANGEKTLAGAVAASNFDYRLAVAISIGATLLIVLLVFFAWFGIHHILIKPLNRLSKSINNITDGDLTQPFEIAGSNELSTFASHLHQMQNALNRTIGNIRTSANTIYHSAKALTLGSSELAERTELQAASLEQTAANMEELTSTVKQNAENAQKANQLALDASAAARQGGKVVSNVVATMNEITESSRRIADITSVIDGIAFQTNILALNAAVEAARAGEQGRGFSVVASEVRNLAQRSALAAREIKTLIDDSVCKVDLGSTLVISAGETIDEVVKATTHVNDLMSEIASASQEQSKGIELVGKAIVEMDSVTLQNSNLVHKSSSESHAMEEQASVLTNSVAEFTIRPA
ncbi:MAG: methyl-accepting chemotaxis protein [Pluralibacter gergoviae]|nr:methyl-accepting chemotaxis protein [Pluralibacter gergoviae]